MEKTTCATFSQKKIKKNEFELLYIPLERDMEDLDIEIHLFHRRHSCSHNPSEKPLI